MPRGGEYDDGPTVASDNPIESGENKTAGAPKDDSDVSLGPPYLPPHVLTKNLVSSNRFPLALTAPPKQHHFRQGLAK